MAAVLALLLAHDAPPHWSHWHLSCTDYHLRVIGVREDRKHSTNHVKWLIEFLREKVEGPCGEIADL